MIVCPPDRQVLVDYLKLRSVLAEEVKNVATCQDQLPQLQQLLLLLELVCHMEYVHESRLVKSAMQLTKPMISQDELHSSASHQDGAAAEQEQALLDSLTALLLEARYFPLSAQEWAVAQRQEFTFGEACSSGRRHAGNEVLITAAVTALLSWQPYYVVAVYSTMQWADCALLDALA